MIYINIFNFIKYQKMNLKTNVLTYIKMIIYVLMNILKIKLKSFQLS